MDRSGRRPHALDRGRTARPTGVAFTTPIRPDEDLARARAAASGRARRRARGSGRSACTRRPRASATPGTTRCDYRFRASTRFREYFDAETLAPAPDPAGPIDPARPVDDGKSVVGPDVVGQRAELGSARPRRSCTRSLPLFRWDEGTEPEQPVAVRRRRRAGVRIYLERPWFSSGEGELLGVLLAPGGDDTWRPCPTAGPVSQWGGDPVWVERAGRAAAPSLVQLDNLLHTAGLDDRPSDAGPLRPPPPHCRWPPYPEQPQVTVLGYGPQYNEERELWYVDVAIDPGTHVLAVRPPGRRPLPARQRRPAATCRRRCAATSCS